MFVHPSVEGGWWCSERSLHLLMRTLLLQTLWEDRWSNNGLNSHKLPLNLNIPLNLLRLNVPAPEGHNWPRPFPPEGGVVNTIERCLCLSNKLLFCLVLVVTLSDLYMILKNHEILFWVLTILLKLVPRWFSGGTTPFTALPSSRRPQAQPVRYRLPKSFKHFSKTEVVLVIQW